MIHRKMLEIIRENKKKNKKSIAMLIDPDKTSNETLLDFLIKPKLQEIDFLFIGGSLLSRDHLTERILFLKKHCDLPLIIFPGGGHHVDKNADGILLLSLISGRNPDLLIGQHVQSAIELRDSGLEILSTGYILIESGNVTAVSYMSNTQPIPREKPEIALSTALAAQFIGMKLIYLDGGSGAKLEVPTETIELISKNVELPIIVGGGINDATKLKSAFEAGADLVVVGTKIEDSPQFLNEIITIKNQINALL